MPVLGITGGVASGKSTFAKLLLQVLPGEFFDSDQCVRELSAQPDVLSEIESAFGSAVFDQEGRLDKVALRAVIFEDPERRAALEAVLHPRVRERWSAMARSRKGSAGWAYVDIPLLFETGVENCFDRVVVIACSPELQQRRLVRQRGMAAGMASKIIASQLDFALRMDKADHVIWNAGSLACLESQAALFATYLQEHYG